MHPEKLPSAIQRYQNETRRIMGVLEAVLINQDWLVGQKLTVADIVFVPFHLLISRVMGEDFQFAKEFPRVFASAPTPPFIFPS